MSEVKRKVYLATTPGVEVGATRRWENKEKRKKLGSGGTHSPDRRRGTPQPLKK